MAAGSPLSLVYQAHRRIIMNRLSGEWRVAYDIAYPVQPRRGTYITGLFFCHFESALSTVSQTCGFLRPISAASSWFKLRLADIQLRIPSPGQHPCLKLKELSASSKLTYFIFYKIQRAIKPVNPLFYKKIRFFFRRFIIQPFSRILLQSMYAFR